MYPPPPWRLSGTVLLALWPVPLTAAQSRLPSGLRALPVRPGRALAGLLLASYDARSTLSYNELIAFRALVRQRARVGMWVSHVYVDDAASLSGGRAIWGMPKQMAAFRFTDRPGAGPAEVRQGTTLLARIRGLATPLRCPQPLIAPVLSGTDEEPLFTLGRGLGKMAPARVQIEVPPESPLVDLSPPRRALGLAGTVRSFTMPPPAPRA